MRTLRRGARARAAGQEPRLAESNKNFGLVAAEPAFLALPAADGPGPPEAFKRPQRFHISSVLYGAFAWARRALNTQNRWSPARAVAGLIEPDELEAEEESIFAAVVRLGLGRIVALY